METRSEYLKQREKEIRERYKAKTPFKLYHEVYPETVSELPGIILFLYYYLAMAVMLFNAIVTGTVIHLSDDEITGFLLSTALWFILAKFAYSGLLFKRSDAVIGLSMSGLAWFFASDFLSIRQYHTTVENLTYNQYTKLYALAFAVLFMVGKVLFYYRRQHVPGAEKGIIDYFHKDNGYFITFLFENACGAITPAVATVIGWLFIQLPEKPNHFIIGDISTTILDEHMSDVIGLFIAYFIGMSVVNLLINMLFAYKEDMVIRNINKGMMNAEIDRMYIQADLDERAAMRKAPVREAEEKPVRAVIVNGSNEVALIKK